MELILCLLLLLFSFLISSIGTYITIHLTRKWQLFEENDYRKIHTEKISSMGGIPIFIALWLSMFLYVEPVILLPMFIATTLLVSIGIWDDLKNIGVKRRIFIQILVASIAYYTGFHFGFTNTIWMSSLNYIITIVFIVLLINGMNFLDGINGLAGMYGVITFLLFAGVFYKLKMPIIAMFLMSYVGALLGFLFFNFGKSATIFMGDNGSTIMGFLMALASLKIINSLPVAQYEGPLNSIVMSLVSIPLLDLCAVVITRIAKGGSPFKADRSHIHHLLTDGGRSHPEACLFILIWMLSMVGVFYFQLVTSVYLASFFIIISYVIIRKMLMVAIDSPTSVVKWDKLAQPPTPTA